MSSFTTRRPLRLPSPPTPRPWPTVRICSISRLVSGSPAGGSLRRARARLLAPGRAELLACPSPRRLAPRGLRHRRGGRSHFRALLPFGALSPEARLGDLAALLGGFSALGAAFAGFAALLDAVLLFVADFTSLAAALAADLRSRHPLCFRAFAPGWLRLSGCQAWPSPDAVSLRSPRDVRGVARSLPRGTSGRKRQPACNDIDGRLSR